jgi:hypothetical protein
MRGAGGGTRNKTALYVGIAIVQRQSTFGFPGPELLANR